MSKIIRPNLNIKSFASNSDTGERTIFGSNNENTNDLDKNINEDYLKGWEVVSSTSYPPKQWFNGSMFTISELVSYLYQYGISEWVSNQEYHKNSVCMYEGKLYVSIVDDNVNNLVTDRTKWSIFSGGGCLIYARDNSSVENKIVLEEYPSISTTEYDDNLYITFKALFKITSPDVTINLNSLGVKRINLVNYGSVLKNDIVVLKFDKDDDLFTIVSDTNKNYTSYEVSEIVNLNDILSSCKLPVSSSHVNNYPSNLNGFLEVTNIQGDVYQKIIDSSNTIYTRVYSNNSWSTWSKLYGDNNYSSIEYEQHKLLFLSHMTTKYSNNFRPGTYLYEVDDPVNKETSNNFNLMFTYSPYQYVDFSIILSDDGNLTGVSRSNYTYRCSVVTKTLLSNMTRAIPTGEMLYENLWATSYLDFLTFVGDDSLSFNVRFVYFLNKDKQITTYCYISNNNTHIASSYARNSWFIYDVSDKYLPTNPTSFINRSTILYMGSSKTYFVKTFS